MTLYGLDEWFWAIFESTCELDLISLLVNIACELVQIMTSYGLDEWFWAMFEPTLTWPNFTFGQLFAGLQKIMIFF